MSDHPTPPSARLSCRVVGHVQGVGFRWFVRERARRLGLTGSVSNASDGSVLVHAGGTPTALDALRALLCEGPPGARVDQLDVLSPTPDPLPDPFQVLR
jgi:acylphosphatase